MGMQRRKRIRRPRAVRPLARVPEGYRQDAPRVLVHRGAHGTVPPATPTRDHPLTARNCLRSPLPASSW